MTKHGEIPMQHINGRESLEAADTRQKESCRASCEILNFIVKASGSQSGYKLQSPCTSLVFLGILLPLDLEKDW